jgi:nucleoside-diphosphate-sugar epimerase
VAVGAGAPAINMTHLFCFGLGYSARALARRLQGEGWRVGGTARTRAGADALTAEGFDACVFDGLSPGPGVVEAAAKATHVLVSVPPDAEGDPVLRHHIEDLASASALAWVGYLSTIGVYCDRHGAWVDETTPLNPTSERGRRRVEAEEAWLALGKRAGARVAIFRLAGIYGPGRSAFQRLRAGTAQRIIKPGQVFNRIHVEDIAAALSASINGSGTFQVCNVTDDEPAPPQDVIAFAAGLLQMPPPPEIAFEDAHLSPMAASFYGENKRVSNARLRTDLAVALKFPSYREGLRAILAADC